MAWTPDLWPAAGCQEPSAHLQDVIDEFNRRLDAAEGFSEEEYLADVARDELVADAIVRVRQAINSVLDHFGGPVQGLRFKSLGSIYPYLWPGKLGNAYEYALGVGRTAWRNLLDGTESAPTADCSLVGCQEGYDLLLQELHDMVDLCLAWKWFSPGVYPYYSSVGLGKSTGSHHAETKQDAMDAAYAAAVAAAPASEAAIADAAQMSTMWYGDYYVNSYVIRRFGIEVTMPAAATRARVFSHVATDWLKTDADEYDVNPAWDIEVYRTAGPFAWDADALIAAHAAPGVNVNGSAPEDVPYDWVDEFTEGLNPGGTFSVQWRVSDIAEDFPQWFVDGGFWGTYAGAAYGSSSKSFGSCPLLVRIDEE